MSGRTVWVCNTRQRIITWLVGQSESVTISRGSLHGRIVWVCNTREDRHKASRTVWVCNTGQRIITWLV